MVKPNLFVLGIAAS